jgi:hypothetical protein
VLVVDLSDGRICASFASPIVMYDDLARVAQMAWHTYKERMPRTPLVRPRCEVVIEINGSGQATAHEAGKIALPYSTMDQVQNFHVHGEDSCVKECKRKVESVGPDGQSMVAGPPELADECEALQKVKGRYTGLKDMIMTYGMALVRRKELGIMDKRWEPPRRDPERVFVEDRMKEARASARRRRV